MSAPWVFQFARPELLGLLVAVALVAFRAWVGRRRRTRDWKRLGQGGRLGRSGALSWLLVLVLLTVALARPRWGRDPDAASPPGHDVVLVIDVSRSMAAEDALPDRLGVARKSAESLVQALGRDPGERVAIVAFAGRAVVRCPLTANLGAAVEILGSLQPGSVEPGGSQLATALDASVSLLEGDRPEPAAGRFVVLFSDGEFHDESWEAVAPRLKALRIPVHALAIGDPEEGHHVPVPEASGGTRPLTYRGEVVLSRRDDQALRAVSQATGGAFLPVGRKPVDLGRLYRERIEPEARRLREPGPLDERSDRFPIFLASALAVSLVALWPRIPRPALVVGLIATGLVAAAPESVSEAIQRGRSAFERGDFQAALVAFNRAITARPDHPLPRYDAAATLYQLHRFDEAEARYREARRSADEGLRRKIDYALGNLAFIRGDYREAVSCYDRCLAAKDDHAGSRLRGDALQNRNEAVRRIPPESVDPEDADDEPGVPGDKPEPPQQSGGSSDDEAGSSNQASPPGTGEPSAPPEGPVEPSSGGDPDAEAEFSESEPPAERLARAVAKIQGAKQRQPTRAGFFKADEDRKDW